MPKTFRDRQPVSFGKGDEHGGSRALRHIPHLSVGQSPVKDDTALGALLAIRLAGTAKSAATHPTRFRRRSRVRPLLDETFESCHCAHLVLVCANGAYG